MNHLALHSVLAAALMAGCATNNASRADVEMLRSTLVQILTEPGSGWAAGDPRQGHLVRVEAVEGFRPRKVGAFKERWYISRGEAIAVYQVEYSSGTSMQLLHFQRPNQSPEPTPTAVTPRATEPKSK